MPDQGPVGVHHVAYACKDIDATHHFYEDLMGFRLVTATERHAAPKTITA
jgi:catechol 2,3-dioxygenase-like lactoylglutathione lyase family enzyme